MCDFVLREIPLPPPPPPLYLHDKSTPSVVERMSNLPDIPAPRKFHWIQEGSEDTFSGLEFRSLVLVSSDEKISKC